MEARLNKQDQSSDALEHFLSKHKDTKPLPKYTDNLEIRGQRVTSPKAKVARRLRRGRRSNKRLHPVDGTAVLASAQYSYTHHAPAVVFPTPFSHPTFEPTFFPGDAIPTIVVERNDNGN